MWATTKREHLAAALGSAGQAEHLVDLVKRYREAGDVLRPLDVGDPAFPAALDALNRATGELAEVAALAVEASGR